MFFHDYSANMKSTENLLYTHWQRFQCYIEYLASYIGQKHAVQFFASNCGLSPSQSNQKCIRGHVKNNEARQSYYIRDIYSTLVCFALD